MTAFVMMPFASTFKDVHKLIQLCVHTVDSGLDALRLDEILAAGSISDDLVKSIRGPLLCIADVTGANPNVMWEVGYATALRKPTVAITQSTDNLPFDIKDVRMVRYDRNRLDETLRTPLTEAIRATLEAYRVPSTHVVGHVSTTAGRRRLQSIAITGSIEARQESTKRKLQATLQPFLGHGIRWYVGSFGSVDEESVELLLEHGESTTVVGYTSYDVSPRMRDIFGRHDSLDFVDAASECLDVDDGGKPERDVWLLNRSDLMVVVWNGRSKGTADLIAWLEAKKRDHLVCYVPPGRVDPQ